MTGFRFSGEWLKVDLSEDFLKMNTLFLNYKNPQKYIFTHPEFTAWIKEIYFEFQNVFDQHQI